MLKYKKLTDSKGAFLHDADGKQLYTADRYWDEVDSIEKDAPIYILDKSAAPNQENILGIIEPTVCTLHQERNGAYEVYLEYAPYSFFTSMQKRHKKLTDSKGAFLHDAVGKQLYTADIYYGEDEIEQSSYDQNRIKPYTVLKVPIMYHDELKYQLFRVTQPSKIMTDSGLMREAASAQHIFYDLKCKILPGEPFYAGGGVGNITGANYTGHADDVFRNLMSTVLPLAPEETRFSCSCNITGVDSTICFEQREQINLVRALLDGSDSFIGRCGDNARLYRDNFRFSINNNTEGYRNIGTIRYGENMTSIDYSEDWTEVYSEVFATDNYENTARIPISDTSMLPCPIQKRIKLEYSQGFDKEDQKIQFDRDVRNYINRHSKPKIHISVTFADIENNPLYADFLDLRNYEVGDYISIYHEDLGIVIDGLEIISKDYDVLEQKTTGIEIGEFIPDGIHENFYAATITEV